MLGVKKMDKDIRNLYHDLVDLVNKYETVPWEARRLALEAVQNMAEKKADEVIREELCQGELYIDEIKIGEDAECKKPTQE